MLGLVFILFGVVWVYVFNGWVFIVFGGGWEYLVFLVVVLVVLWLVGDGVGVLCCSLWLIWSL